MEIIPAIDLVDGKCVRLMQGQYHRQITYHDNPVEQAREFAEAGANWIHIIDLDGARIGEPLNIKVVEDVAKQVSCLKIEIGGGVRDENSISKMLDAGVERVIIGTNAVSDFDWFSKMAKKFSGKLVLGLDARGSKIAIRGWMEDSPQKLCDFAIQAAALPLAAIIYTDIAKDGMMAGPNFERTKAVVDAVDIPVIASGGVTELDDIVKLKQLGVAGAIIGRVLYEGKMNLAEAIQKSKT